MNLDYTIIVPVYDEVKSLNDTCRTLKELLSRQESCRAIILVDDGSKDGSGDRLDEIAREDTHVMVIHHPVNKGYGAALKTGITASETNIVVIIDADLSYPNERIPELVDEMSGHDMAVGSRKKSLIPLLRRPAKWVINKLANYLSGTNIPDLNSGLRAMRKETVLKFMNILPDGFSFTTTITLAMLTSGDRIKYVPIDYFKRKGKSKIHPIKDTLNFIQLIIRTVMYFEPLKIFVPVSLVLLLLSLGVFVFSYFFLEKILDTTTAILFIGGIQLLAIGMLADLIDKRNRN
jgi:glycosyltransferase involved in cell wall biosynthesis